MSTSRYVLLDHTHIGDQHISSFVDLIRLVLQDYEHVMLHTPRSCPHWRSTHLFLRWFDSPSTTDYEHVTLHTPWSCSHWRSKHPFLRRFDSHTIRRLWARCLLLDHAHIGDQHIIPSFVDLIRLVLQDHEHVTYYSIMATLERIRNEYYLTYHSRSP
jgi:hypothetical protein